MNDLVLINHNTLTIEHADLCVCSISSNNQTNNIQWNTIYIYNSCDYISNNSIIELLDKYNIVYNTIIEMNVSNIKTLNSDLSCIANQCNTKNNVVLLKCDYALSKRFNEILSEYDNTSNFLYSLPVTNAKEFVSDDEIKTLVKNDEFIICNNYIYYRGSDLFEPKQECRSTQYDDTHGSIRFVSWGGSLDYNVHYMSGNNLHFFTYSDPNQGWGRCTAFDKMLHNGTHIINSKKSFCVHKYHYTNERNDHRKNVHGQKY